MSSSLSPARRPTHTPHPTAPFPSLRLDITGSFSLPSLPSTWTVDRPVSFLRHASISSAMNDPHALPFIIEHDWSDVDPDPPDSDFDPHPLSSSDDDIVI